MRRCSCARTAAVVAVVAALALGLLAASTHAQNADPIGPEAAAPKKCPKYCDMCVRTRGKRTVSTETVVNSGRRLMTEPLVTRCVKCKEGFVAGVSEDFVPNKPATVCECPPGSYLSNGDCLACPDGSVSKQGSTSADACKSCPTGSFPDPREGKCVEPASVVVPPPPPGTPAPPPGPPGPAPPGPAPPGPAPPGPAPPGPPPGPGPAPPPAPTPNPPLPPGVPPPISPPGQPRELLEACTQDSDCGTPQAICNPATGTCTYKPNGGLCARDGRCGMCQPNCGVNTEASTCAAYGFSPGKKTCNHSAAGGGGKECGPTQICCVVWNPVKVQPDAQNSCLPKATGR